MDTRDKAIEESGDLLDPIDKDLPDLEESPLSEEEIQALQKKGRLIYRPKVENGQARTADGQRYIVDSVTKVWRLATPRVRMSKKERLRRRRQAEKSGDLI